MHVPRELVLPWLQHDLRPHFSTPLATRPTHCRSSLQVRQRLSHAHHHHSSSSSQQQQAQLWLEDDSPEEAEERPDADEGGPSRQRQPQHMWLARFEQQAWVLATTKACTAPRLAYVAACLTYHAAALQLGAPPEKASSRPARK